MVAHEADITENLSLFVSDGEVKCDFTGEDINHMEFYVSLFENYDLKLSCSEYLIEEVGKLPHRKSINFEKVRFIKKKIAGGEKCSVCYNTTFLHTDIVDKGEESENMSLCTNCLGKVMVSLKRLNSKLDGIVEYSNKSGFMIIDLSEEIEFWSYINNEKELSSVFILLGTSLLKVSMSNVIDLIDILEGGEFSGDFHIPQPKYTCLICHKNCNVLSKTIITRDTAVCESCKKNLKNQLKGFIEDNGEFVAPFII